MSTPSGRGLGAGGVSMVAKGDFLSNQLIATQPEEEGQSAVFARKPLAFRPSLHSLSYVVRQMIPYYGSECRVMMVYNINTSQEEIVTGTLDSIGREFEQDVPFKSNPLIMVG